MISVILYEGWFSKENPEFEKYCKLAAEAYARAQVEREVAEQKGYQTFTKSDIEYYVDQYSQEVYKVLFNQLKDPEKRSYYKNLYPKDFERQLRAERWTAKEIKYMLEFLKYVKKAVEAYEDDSKWR